MRPFIAFIAFIAIPLSAHAAPPGPIIISELMWMGSTRSSADEWIELYNRGDAIVDLSGWTLTRLSGDEDQIMLTFAGGTVAPGQTFLIANYTAKHENSRLAVQSQYVAPAVSLPNTKLLLRLYDGNPQEGGKLVDVVDDGRGTPFRGDAALKQAMVRIAFDQGGDQPESWATATEQSGWDDGATELGTPGSIPAHLSPDEKAADQTGIDTLIEPITWARLKENLSE